MQYSPDLEDVMLDSLHSQAISIGPDIATQGQTTYILLSPQ